MFIVVISIPLALSCDGGFGRGDCDPGYLDVNGTCRIAVGQNCNRDGDCLSSICVKKDDDNGFCTVKCKSDEDCPVGFYCDSDLKNLCFPGKRPEPCDEDSDCDACQECLNGQCIDIEGCIACSSDEDCQACQRCDQERCINVAGCTRCETDLDCPACEICAVSGQCEALAGCTLCAVDSDCPGCETCSRGGCVPIPGCGIEHCFNDNDCPPRTRCLYNNDLQDTTCLPVDLSFGEDCQRGGDAMCAGGICIAGEEGEWTCSRECDTDDDCPDYTVCRPDADCLWACRQPFSPPPGSECFRDEDCSEDRLCGLVPDEQDQQWDERCIVPKACVSLPGEACEPGNGDMCTTGTCTQSGYCSGVCAGDLDCPPGFLCDLLELDLPGGLPANFPGCEPAESVQGETGEPCTAGDQDCKGGVCLTEGADGPVPYCTRSCTPGEADCPDRFSCLEWPAGSSDYYCRPSLIGGECATDGDCPDGEVCRLNESLSATLCAEPVPGGVAAGETCNTQTACENETCLDQGVCSALCLSDLDCPEGMSCEYADLLGPSGARTFARLCALQESTRTVCQIDGDCEPALSCKPVLNSNGTGFDGRCFACASGAGIGIACSADCDCDSGFCSDAGFCSSLCITNTDCPAMFECKSVGVPLGNNEVILVDGCVEIILSELGEPCPDGDDDCVEGLICFEPLIGGDTYCSLECSSNEDCSDVDTMLCLGDGAGGSYCQFF